MEERAKDYSVLSRNRTALLRNVTRNPLPDARVQNTRMLSLNSRMSGVNHCIKIHEYCWRFLSDLQHIKYFKLRQLQIPMITDCFFTLMMMRCSIRIP